MVFSPHTQTPSAHSVPLFPPLLRPGPLPTFPSPPPCSLTATLSVSASAQTPCLSASSLLHFHSPSALLQAVCLCTFLLIFPSLSPVSAWMFQLTVCQHLSSVSLSISLSLTARFPSQHPPAFSVMFLFCLPLLFI